MGLLAQGENLEELAAGKEGWGENLGLEEAWP